MRKLLATTLAVGASLALSGQGIYERVLGEIEANNPTLAAARKTLEAERLSARATARPADPEASFLYQFGGGEATENKIGFEVSQSFDFPTAYRHRSAAARGAAQMAQARYAVERREVLAEAQRAVIELIHANAAVAEAMKQERLARHTSDAYAAMLKAGQSGVLAANKARAALAEAISATALAHAERGQRQARLRELNGGNDIAVADSVFPPADIATLPATPADAEQWARDQADRSPDLLLAQAAADEAAAQIGIGKAAVLPRLALGVGGEFVGSERFLGPTVGISLPLWENRGAVQTAQASLGAAEATREGVRAQIAQEMAGRLAQARGAAEALEALTDGFDPDEHLRLARKALEQGKMPLLHFLEEAQFASEYAHALLDARRDLQLALAALRENDL